MKKRLVTLLLACMATVSVTACSIPRDLVNQIMSGNEQQTQVKPQGSENPDRDGLAFNDHSVAKGDTAENSQKLYEAFLEGIEKVYTEEFDGFRYNEEGNKIHYYEANDGYTLEEFLAVTIENESLFEERQQIGEVAYQIIDCGADGVPELLMQVWLTVDSFYPEERQYVMKAMDGKLQLTYQNQSNSYVQESIYTNTGAISHTTMYSYDNWYEGAAYLDANGKYRPVYTGMVYMFTPAADILDERFSEAIKKNESELEEVYLRVYYIGEEPEDANVYYCGEKEEDEPSNGYDFEENTRILKQVFDETGDKLYSMQEIQSMIAAREAEIGVTDAIKNGEYINLTDIELNISLSYDNGQTDLIIYSPANQISDNGNVILFWDEMEYSETTETYIMDEYTYFNENADMAFFEGYEDGDTPMDWVRRMLGQTEDYPTALSGVFDISVSDGHIDCINGIYWWD